MTERVLAWDDWLSTALAILSPACATLVASSAHAMALAILFWALGAICPIAWILGEVRRSGRRAVILATACKPQPEEARNGRA